MRESKARRKLHHRSLVAPLLARSRNHIFTDPEDDDFKAYLACALPSGESCQHKPKHMSKPMRTFSRQDQWREALVFQQLPNKLIPTIQGAKDATEKGWTKLESKQVWILDSVQDQDEVSKQAKKTGKTVHFGRVFGFCAIKHSELAEEKRKYKGRVVFEGNRVRDESGLAAIFQDQNSSASPYASWKIPGCSQPVTRLFLSLIHI